MSIFVRFAVVVAVSLLAACASTGGYDRRPMGHPNYGGFYPNAGGPPEPGDYALRAATSLKRIQDFASCDGEGFSETRSRSRTGERDFRYGGYQVEVEQSASCAKMGGSTIPPRGVRRQER